MGKILIRFLLFAYVGLHILQEIFVFLGCRAVQKEIKSFGSLCISGITAGNLLSD